MSRSVLCVAGVALILSVTALSAQFVTTNLSSAEALAIVEALPAAARPPTLAVQTSESFSQKWSIWLRQHHRELRARLDQGDEDSIVQMMLFGSSFTSVPPVPENDILRMAEAGRGDEVLRDRHVRTRLDDLISSIGKGSNARVELVEDVLARKHIDPRTPDGRRMAHEFFERALERVLSEYRQYLRRQKDGDADRRAVEQLTLFRDRGLSSDTSIFPNFGIDAALTTMKAEGRLTHPIRRVAIIGPGLDFTDRRGGHDFYPQQTLQPFAVIDSLIRAHLAVSNDLIVSTIDVSSRVTSHLLRAVARAGVGEPYTVQLPQDISAAWTDELLAYWLRFGDAVGEETQASVPPSASGVRIRGVRISPEIVRAIAPDTADIVTQRLTAALPNDAFDLIVATNVLIYYDVFEQCLSMANVARMLRPGGMLLTNSAILQAPGTPLRLAGSIGVQYTKLTNGKDQMFWFERQ